MNVGGCSPEMLCTPGKPYRDTTCKYRIFELVKPDIIKMKEVHGRDEGSDRGMEAAIESSRNFLDRRPLASRWSVTYLQYSEYDGSATVHRIHGFGWSPIQPWRYWLPGNATVMAKSRSHQNGWCDLPLYLPLSRGISSTMGQHIQNQFWGGVLWILVTITDYRFWAWHRQLLAVQRRW